MKSRLLKRIRSHVRIKKQGESIYIFPITQKTQSTLMGAIVTKDLFEFWAIMVKLGFVSDYRLITHLNKNR